MNLGARLLPVIDRAADFVWPRGRRRTFDNLIEMAAGLRRDDAGSALLALLQAYREEAELSTIGLFAARWEILRFLTNLRRFEEEEARNPAILDQPIEAPIIITGLPRSGTTFLHGLLAEDPTNQTLRCWQAIYPYPDQGQGTQSDLRPRRVGRQLQSFAWLAPDLRSVHPIDSWTPQECTEITAHVFQSTRFDMTHHVPSYRTWLDGHGHIEAYRFHKRFLQHLQHQSGPRRWVLKAPDHVFALDALRSVYPDARIVFVHRDPLKMLPSVARLTEIVRAPFTRRIDRLQIGRQVTRDWTLGAQQMIEAGRAMDILHVHHRDLISHPIETVERLYRHFGIVPDPEGMACVTRQVAAKPDGGYGRNVYSFDAFGIDPDDVRRAFRSYMDHFAIAREVDSGRGATGNGVKGIWASGLRSGQHSGS